MSYQVRTEVFEGPFDLLLHLIAKRELDIYEVSLAAITEEYLAHLKQMQEELDLEVATEFLVVAATLIEIKASRLLPGPARDDDELDVSDRDLLIARLLEYRAFKDAAAKIADALSANEGFVPRTAGPGEEFAKITPDLMARVSAERFAEIAARVLTPKTVPHVDFSHIAPIRISVAEAIAKVRAVLLERKRVTFRDLTREVSTDRLHVIVRFLAVLELVKRGEADVTQTGSFTEIEVSWLGEQATSRVIALDEYDGTWTDDDTTAQEIRLDEPPTIDLDPDATTEREDG